MQVELRRTSKARTAYRAVLWAGVLLVAGLLYLRANPWPVEVEADASEGIEISREAQADVIIVLDYDAIAASPAHFERHDWSASWINTIEQEIGPVSVATPRSLSTKVLGEARVVILTASVSDQISDALMKKLREHIEAGNLLVMERPGGALREAYAADGRAGTRRGQRFTFAAGLDDPYANQLRQLPLSSDYIGSTRALDGATTLLSIDGAPVVYAKPVGRGHVMTVDFDYGEALVALQQGKPTQPDLFTVVPRSSGEPAPGDEDEEAAPPRVSDLVMHEDLVGAKVPYADILERFIVHGAILRYAPSPALWAYPHGAAGVVVAIHADDRLGDGGGWMLDYENDRRAVSSLLTTVDAGLSAATAATLHRKGGDIGLLWRMEGTPAQLTERLGVGGFEPMKRPVTLARQIDRLKQTLPVNYARSIRVADGWWTRQWAEPFGAMAAQGFRIDMSYEVPRTAGFAFGTGLPFLALNAEGKPLGVRELPVVFPDAASEGPRFKELLASSKGGHHMALTFALDPASFADTPDMERFDRWLALFDQVAEHDHRITSAYRFDTFMRQRRASSMRSRLVRGVDLPQSGLPAKDRRDQDKDEDTDAERAASPEATLLRVTVEAKTKGMMLVLPAHHGARHFHSARKRSQREGTTSRGAPLTAREVSLIGLPMRLVPLEQGFNTIDVFYTPTPEAR